MISYGKLWTLLKEKGMKRTDLLEVISSPTLTKLGKNENINVSIIGKICDYLNCQPGDIMENVNEEKLKTIIEQFGQIQQVMIDSLKEKGISENEFLSMLDEALPAYFKKMYNGENPMTDILKQAVEEMENSQMNNDNGNEC